ncbi:MAG: hypothetical protein ACI860_000623 [Chitinophagales bacterium]|jgi:hypothetical protein
MSTEIKLNRPTPITPDKELEVFNKYSDSKETIKLLEAGTSVLVNDFYSNGMTIIREIQTHLRKTMPNKSFQEQRDFRSAYRKLSSLVLIEVNNHKLNVKKAPSIGWLNKLYPEKEPFLLPFPQVQGMNSSWQWYQNGILIPVLRNKIHPFYGTYFPTRFDHLILFDNWLKRYEGPKKSAIDIGIGSGVLSFQLVRHGFQKVFGTDTNPNAIVGLKEFMGETKLSRKIDLAHAPLFGSFEKETELIVFNPPWLPATDEMDSNDEAIYYKDKLFPEFFAEAKKHLSPDGKLVIIFSNLAQITEVSKSHPIQEEIDKGGRFKLDKSLTRPVKAASDKTKRDQHWRSSEEVELWILTHK